MQIDETPPLRSAVRDGAFWLALGAGGQKLLGLAAGIVLARLLYPEDFGLFALAALAYELAALFDGLGTAQYVVTAADPKPRLDVVHRINLLLALGLALILCAAAPLFALVFREPRLTTLVPVLAAALPLGAWGAVQRALLERELRLAEIAKRRLAVNTLSLVLMVVLAGLGFGVWALALPVPIRSAVNSWLNRRLHPYRPPLTGAGRGASEVIAYGKHIVGYRLTQYFSGQLDNGIIGRRLGAAGLGIYEFAHQAAMMPVRWVGDLVTRLSLPVLSLRLRSGGESAADTLLEATRWTAYLAGPVVCGLVVVARDWVTVLYGARWIETVPLIRVLAPAALALLLARPMIAWLQASGRESAPMRIQGVFLPLMGAAVWVSAPRGLPTIAAVVSATLVLQSLALLGFGCGRGGIRPLALLRAVWSGLFPSVIVLAGLIPWSRWAAGIDSAVVRLSLAIPVTVLLFLAASWAVARPQLRTLLTLARRSGR